MTSGTIPEIRYFGCFTCHCMDMREFCLSRNSYWFSFLWQTFNFQDFLKYVFEIKERECHVEQRLMLQETTLTFFLWGGSVLECLISQSSLFSVGLIKQEKNIHLLNGFFLWKQETFSFIYKRKLNIFWGFILRVYLFRSILVMCSPCVIFKKYVVKLPDSGLQCKPKYVLPFIINNMLVVFLL